MKELVDRFATSVERVAILNGFLDFRQVLFGLGVTGFHWIDGSFLEDIELLESRPPGDIDVVTFVTSTISSADLAVRLETKSVLRPSDVKRQYKVDHYTVALASRPELLVSQVSYWYGLFSHQRGATWKGMVKVDLADPADDAAARILIGGRP